ncbi:hypothetical protein [Streptococcus gordonii]|uniref:hypothetical protein n=1 Tax=Streptococcus gordonii TaxID=1302 RepID=UPI000F663839|nr:hypothetical protein [Streptococcus gordonii]RSJ62103.1 hypothetical protein D8807_04735 [Streptococcus gordonii]
MRVKYLSLFSGLLWMSQSLLHFLLMLGLPLGRLVFGGAFVVFPLWLRPVNFLLFSLWAFFSFSYLAFGDWLKSGLRSSVLKKVILVGTVFLFLATFFNFFISTSLLEKYLTGGLTFLAFLSSSLLHNKKKSYHD